MARVPYARRDKFPNELKYVWDAIAEGAEPPNIFKTLGNNPALLRAYLRMGNGLWDNCGLDEATRELVILRSAYNAKSEYEWHQHVQIGMEAGLSKKQINALPDWRNSNLFSANERTLLAYADAVAQDAPPPDEAFEAMVQAYGISTTIGVTLLVAFYEMTAKFLGALHVETEEDFVGWNV